MQINDMHLILLMSNEWNVTLGIVPNYFNYKTGWN